MLKVIIILIKDRTNLDIFNCLCKVFSGEKPKKGPFNGSGTLYFGGLNTGNVAKLYGVRNKKCLKLFNNQVRSISGHFENDVLMVSTKPNISMYDLVRDKWMLYSFYRKLPVLISTFSG